MPPDQTRGVTVELPPIEPVIQRTGLAGWLMHGATADGAEHAPHPAHPWYQVLWLTGVDYFSTLGYQPGIALLAAGALSPIATAILVLVTLGGALPIYAEVARHSYIGQGSIAMLERLLPGWRSKLFVLVLLGFASTDFVITMTLSAADAAKHVIENPYLEPIVGHGQLWITLALLALLTLVFLRGFAEAIGVAVAVGLPYMVLNAIVVGRCGVEIARRPELLANWRAALSTHGDWTMVLLAAGVTFPRLALGLSGFETGVSVMPVVKGDPADETSPVPFGRIRNTRKMLATAAVLMSLMLLSTSFVTAVLVPYEAYHEGGPAAGRVLAYLAHELLGNAFGTLYDIATILILWFAGASAMAGLLNLIPRYLPRLGMAPQWVAYSRPLVLLLFAIDVVVTLAFGADVEAQGGAYATGVLALIFSASVAVALSHRDARHHYTGSRVIPRGSAFYWGIAAVLAYTLLQNIHERPDGLIIASLFIASIVLLSSLSRYLRSTELRVSRIAFEDQLSAAIWPEMVGKRVNLVPVKHCERPQLQEKAEEIRRHYRVTGPLAFLHVYLRDDRSDFSSEIQLRVSRMEGDYVIEARGAVAIANTIAYISELLDPISIFLGLTRRNTITQALSYLLWGEGETGIRVYEVLLRHWEHTPEDDVRPLIFIMSE